MSSPSASVSMIALYFGLAFGAMSLGACDLPGGAPRSPSPDGLSCGQRLVGGWHIVGFAPDVPLAPDTAAALQGLHQQLRVTFDGQRAITTAPSLHHVQPYRIDGDSGVDCTVTAPDDAGVENHTQIHFFDPNHIQVIEHASPVPGRSTMERTAPVY